jgi:hypothetical protein
MVVVLSVWVCVCVCVRSCAYSHTHTHTHKHSLTHSLTHTHTPRVGPVVVIEVSDSNEPQVHARRRRRRRKSASVFQPLFAHSLTSQRSVRRPTHPHTPRYQSCARSKDHGLAHLVCAGAAGLSRVEVALLRKVNRKKRPLRAVGERREEALTQILKSQCMFQGLGFRV